MKLTIMISIKKQPTYIFIETRNIEVSEDDMLKFLMLIHLDSFLWHSHSFELLVNVYMPKYLLSIR